MSLRRVAKRCATRREAGGRAEKRGRPRVVFAACAAPNSSGPIPDRHCDHEHALAGAPDTHCRRSLHARKRSTSGSLYARSVCAPFAPSCDFALNTHPESDA